MEEQPEDLFSDLESELRQRVGGEFRRDAEEGERLAAQAAMRDRTLSAVAQELMQRGDTVAVALPGRTFTGTVTHAASGLMTLRTRTGVVDINLATPLHLHVVERVRSGGSSGERDPATFRGRLLEHELAGHLLECGSTVVADVVRGRLVAVGLDHVVLRAEDGVEVVIPTAALAYVARWDW